MALTHIIAQRIVRNSPTTPTQLTLKEKRWPVDGLAEDCFRELRQAALKRTGKDYGRFSSDSGAHPLATWLAHYLDDQLSFENLSHKACELFKQELDKTEDVLEGYLVFAHEKLEHDEIFHLFFVQNNQAHYVDGDLDLSQCFYLDTAGIKLAAKVNLNDWRGEDSHRAANCVVFMRWRGEKELTETFETMLGFTDKADLTAETEAFLELVSDYTKELPADTAQYTKQQVVEYCLEQDKRGQPVVIADLSSELKDNPAPRPADNATPAQPMPEFSRFVEQKKPQSKPELIPDKSQLKHYVRISGRSELLSMSFASSCLGDTVVYDAQEDSLIIKNIPPSLKMRLAKHFQDN